MKLKTLKYFLTILIGGGIFLSSFFIAQAYSPHTTHFPLTERSVDLYNRFYSDSALTAQQKQWVAQGSADEDSPLARVVYHFYDPINNKGVDGYHSSKVWARRADLQTGVGGVYTWEVAIKAYQMGDYEYAYKALGHILHLIQDVTVPAHTRNDPHPPVAYGDTDPYEQGVKKFSAPSITGMRPVLYGSLNTYFDRVATYTNTQFLSQDSVGFYAKPDLVRMDENYIYGKDSKGEYRLVKIKKELGSNLFNFSAELHDDAFSDHLVLQDYWNRLAPTAIQNGAGVIKLFHDTVQNLPPIEPEQSGGILSNIKNSLEATTNAIKSAGVWISNLGSFLFERHAVDIKITPNQLDAPVAYLQTGTSQTFNFEAQTHQNIREQQAQDSFNQQLNNLALNSVTNTQGQQEQSTEDTTTTTEEPAQQPTTQPEQPQEPPTTEQNTIEQEQNTTEQEQSILDKIISNTRRIFSNNQEQPDTEAPTTTNDLSAQSGTQRGSVNLTWTAPSDNKGVANYIIKYSNEEITEENWDTATEVTQNLTPKSQGEQESLTINNLNPAQEYNFALRAKDEAGNESALSNTTYAKASAVPTHLVINEVQIADAEFVELYNPTNSAIDLSDHYFAYYSSTRTSWNNPHRLKQFPQNAKIPSKGYFLIGLKDYPQTGGNPNSDWQAYDSAQLSNSAGTVAIFNQDPTCGDETENCNPHPLDAVAWGPNDEITLKETKTAFVPGTNQSIGRTQHWDTDDNSQDFTIQTLSPKNSSKAVTSAAPIWQSWQNNSQNTGISSHKAPSSEPAPTWNQFLTPGTVSVRTPVVDADGNVYVSTNEITISYSPQGETRWSYGSGNNLALSADSQYLYIVETGGPSKTHLSVLSTSDGSLINKFDLGVSSAHPTINNQNGDVYITNKSNIFAFNKQGDLKWHNDWSVVDWPSIWNENRSPGKETVNASVHRVFDPVFLNNKLYIVAHPSNPSAFPFKWYVFAFDASDGSFLWQRNLRQSIDGMGRDMRTIQAGASVNANGHMAVGYGTTSPGMKFGVAVYDINNNGEIIWYRELYTDSIDTVPVIDNLGNVFVYIKNRRTVYKLNYDGEQITTTIIALADSPIRTPIVLDSTGNIYFGDDDGTIYSIPKSSGDDGILETLWAVALNSKIMQLILANNSIYTVTDEKILYKLQP